jgi:ribosomal protein L37AE/L43A
MNKCVHCKTESDEQVTCYESNSYSIDTGKYENNEHWYCRNCKKSWCVVKNPKNETTMYGRGTICNCCKNKSIMVRYENGYWYCPQCHDLHFKSTAGVVQHTKEKEKEDYQDPPFLMQSLEGM